MWLTNNVLREILYKNNTVCCLCLKMTGEGGEDALHTYDEITLKDPDITINLSSIITLVFENKILKTEFVSHAVCEDCAKSAISAFKFVEKCTDINKKMTSVLMNLKNCLDKTDNENLVKARGIYVATDPRSFQSKAYCDRKKSVSTISTLLKRFKAFLRTEKGDEENVLPSLSHKILFEKWGVEFSHSYSLNNHQKFSCKDTKKTYNDNKNNDFDSEQGELMNTDENNDFDSEQGELMNTDENNDFDSEHSEIKRKQRKTYFDNLERVSCIHCGIICRNKYNLKKHMQRNCKVIKAKTISDDATSFLNNLDLKLKTPQQSKEIKPQFEHVICNYCDKSFRNKSVLKVHIHRVCKGAPSKSQDKTSICSFCGKEVRTELMKIHESNHTSRFECSKCGKVLKTLRGYNKHLLIPKCNVKTEEVIPPDRKYSCHICGKLFANKRYIKGHVQAQHSDSGFECKLCEKKLSSQSSLKLHMVVHTKHKDFKCETCGGKFVSKASLLYHTRTHTGEKPYKCKYCDNWFLSASRRNIHTRIHHLPPQLECKFCMKLFTHWAALIKHRRRHFIPSSSLYMGNVDSQVLETNKNPRK